ncbi:MAG: hypothetical protein ISR61_09990 [Desulfobacteraceae bacterium]|nr:hypothetical protein [Desulfobacteraceae bacterium]
MNQLLYKINSYLFSGGSARFHLPTWSIFDTRLQLPYTSSRGRFTKVSEGLQGMNELVAKELA